MSASHHVDDTGPINQNVQVAIITGNIINDNSDSHSDMRDAGYRVVVDDEERSRMVGSSTNDKGVKNVHGRNRKSPIQC